MNKIVLQVNRAEAGQVQVNIQTQVNSASIRRDLINGRDSWIVPSYTLPAGVIMNGGLYPAAEIDAHYKELEGTVAPLGHPTANGQFVSAFSPEGLAGFYAGATNQNVKKSGNRVYIEKVVDVETAQGSEKGRRLLERLEALEKGEDVPPIHTSVAAFLEQIDATNAESESDGYTWIAKIHQFDHDAILLDQVGAATPEQGVGMMVNADQAVPFAANAGALAGESYRDKENRLSQAAKAKFAPGNDDYTWVADFTDDQAVIVKNGGEAQLYGYKVEAGRIVFDDTGTKVVRQESWVAKLPVINQLLKLFSTHQARPDFQPKEAEMALTPEEQAALLKEVGTVVSANVAEALAPLSAKVEALETNHKALSDTLTANAKAEEAEKRAAVAAVHGEVVANALSGDALDAMHKSLGSTTPIGNSAAVEQAETGAPDPVAHFGGK